MSQQAFRDVASLWTFVTELDHDSRMALFAHCVALTVNAVELPWERRSRTQATADKLAEAVSIDMTGYWRPTVRTYLGRITKARILEAVRRRQHRCCRPDGEHEEARYGGSRRAVAGRNRLAAPVDENAASRPRARRVPAGDAITELKDTEAYSVAAE
jgi:ParB family chromosome partitioning protein